MARSQIFPDDVLTRSQVCFSSERQRDAKAVDLAVASHPHQIVYTVDYVWEQDTSSPAFGNFPQEVQDILARFSPYFAMRLVFYPYSPHGQIFPLVVLLQAYQNQAVFMCAYDSVLQDWQPWSAFHAD